MKGKNKNREKKRSKEPFSFEATPNPPQVINPSEKPPGNFTTIEDEKDMAKHSKNK
jgi:hypothetical protein